MKLQDTPSSCGPHALANALEALHGRGCGLTPEVLEALTGDTAVRGCSARDMRRAISRSGHVAVKLESVLQLVGSLALGAPSVLIVDADTHWIAAVGMLGATRVLTVDSADGGVARAYSLAELAERWRCRRRFYGLAVELKRS